MPIYSIYLYIIKSLAEFGPRGGRSREEGSEGGGEILYVVSGSDWYVIIDLHVDQSIPSRFEGQ